jgi:branched-chain amino acid transport system ATP-binding protein
MGLAPIIQKEVFKAISALRSSGMTILISEQFARYALAVSDRVYNMERGKAVLEGASSELTQTPAVVEAYLG